MPRLGLALDELKTGDIAIESNGVSLIVRHGELLYFQGLVLDYDDSPFGSGMVIRPRVVS